MSPHCQQSHTPEGVPAPPSAAFQTSLSCPSLSNLLTTPSVPPKKVPRYSLFRGLRWGNTTIRDVPEERFSFISLGIIIMRCLPADHSSPRVTSWPEYQPGERLFPGVNEDQRSTSRSTASFPAGDATIKERRPGLEEGSSS